MSSGREAQRMLEGISTFDLTISEKIAIAKIHATLALADAIDGVGEDIRDAARDVATELGSIATSSLLSDAPSFVISDER